MLEYIHFLDLIWVFAFSIYWTYYALKENLDLFWIFVSAFLTALWWWTIREIFLNHIPFYFYDYDYILVVTIWMIFTIFVYKYFHKIKNFAIIIDSIWLVVFSFIWASVAKTYSLWLFWIVFFATLTAVWGGILRDIILNKTPLVFKYDLYATISMLLWFVYWLFLDKMNNPFYVAFLIFVFLLIRFYVIYKKLNLWKMKG